MTPDPIPHARESAVEVLRSLEWCGDSYGLPPYCPVCKKLERFWKHAPDCRLAAALANPTPAPSGDDGAELRAALALAQSAAEDYDRDCIDMRYQRDAAEDRATAAEARCKELEEAVDGALFHFFCCGPGIAVDDDCGQLVPTMARLARLVGFKSDPATDAEIANVLAEGAVLCQHQKGEGYEGD